MYHSVHNIYIQKTGTPLTISNDNSPCWIDECGLMIPIITAIGTIYFWRKAEKENFENF